MEKRYFVHPTAVVDEPVEIGEGTQIWHFSCFMSGVWEAVSERIDRNNANLRRYSQGQSLMQITSLVENRIHGDRSWGKSQL